MQEAYVYDAVRTPCGRGKPDGKLHRVTPVELVRQLLHAILERNGLTGEEVEDVILGCVTQIHEQGSNIAKIAAQAAGLPETVAGVSLNRFCASGLEAINQASAYIRSGMVEKAILAGGVESMSRVPMGSDGGAWYTDPAIAYEGNYIPQGVSADLIATLYGFSRQAVDAYAERSHKLAAQATREGKFQKSLIPVRDLLGRVILDYDENIRPDTSVEKLATLPASFEEIGKRAGYDAVALLKYPQLEKIHHIHHAGNSSAIVDGASLVLVASEEWGRRYGLRPRARIVSWAITGTEPTIMLLGPIPATEKALQRAGLSKDAIDLYQVNEAFAAVVLRFMQALEIPLTKVNVNGGAIAMGHPLGATGAILLTILLDELEAQNLRYGLVTLCVGGGMGIATLIEKV
ncbi:MAG: acetyl-CoA C-acetyltransferase [Bacteroidia bacterium]